ncbi:MAG: hypothetical protein K6U08_08460 [Firmicutes bacterium]|nr:hypothetical protein [Bacillota bacterium]
MVGEGLHRPAVVLLLVAGLVLALAGCGPEDESFQARVGALEWSLGLDAAKPGMDGAFVLTLTNRGSRAVRLGDGEAVLVAEVGEWGDLGRVASGRAALPGQIAPGSSARVALSLPTRPEWPDSFTVRALVSPVGESGAGIAVAEADFRPGAILVRALWPPGGYVDFPPGDSLILEFEPAVSLESLTSSLTLAPYGGPGPSGEDGPSGDRRPLVLEVREAPEYGPAAYEVRPVDGLEPFTRYSLSISAALKTRDGSVTMGRDRAVVFSTGPVAGLYEASWRPVWSPDGSKVAWVAPHPEGGLALYVGDVSTMRARAVAGRSAGGFDVAGSAPAFGSDGTDLYFGTRTASGVSVARLDLAGGKTDVLIAARDLGDADPVALSVSPDGAFLAVETNLGAADAHSDVMKQVWVYNLARHELLPGLGRAFSNPLVGWSGSRLLFATTYVDGSGRSWDHSHHFRYDLYTFEPAGRPGQTREVLLLGGGRLENVGGYSSACADVDLLAYWSWVAEDLGGRIVHTPRDIWLVRGLNRGPVVPPVRLTSGGSYREVALSPDGSRVAAARARAGSLDLVVVAVSDGAERMLTGGPAAEMAPSWSPTGRRLAFLEGSASGLRVGLVDLETGVLQFFTIGP